ncbi:MAG: proline/glycine betaine ABC transporter permease [Deltaproteobacteria bacterium]|nr:proline/glycine betaine ABC transporter permease [Deltaproteobacteria bacterium]MBW2137807.1 proline/glycine betaine ABC transporter permease [Deltaproteobacteria bacterium]
MNDFPEIFRIPMADWIDAAMGWLLSQWGELFDTVGKGILQFLLYLENFFLWIPWYVLVVLIGLAAWRLMGRWWHGPLMAALLVLIGTFGYWNLAMRTLALVSGAVILSLVLGIPLGIAMARSNLLESVTKPILDGMQTMPSFVYLIPALMLFGLGKVPALFATIIYAMPPVIRLTNVGIREVPHSVIEAAEAFGSDSWQVLFNVQIPLARPSIMVGINQTTMMALAMVVIASMIGARGLGMEVLLAINRIEVGRGFEAGLSIVILAIIIDRLTHALAERQKR